MPELNFDSKDFAPIGDFEVLPIGDYVVTITSSEKKTTKPKEGRIQSEYINLTLTVQQDGQYKGRKIFHALNINNPSADSAEIAKRTLSSICTITGVPRPKMTEELHDKPFMVKVGIRPGEGSYQPSNDIKAWKYADGTKIKAHTTNSVPAGIVSDGKKSLPWEKK
jgi:hypothetical protein